MSHHHPFYFIQTLWDALRHADWEEAEARSGIFGLIAEFFRALTGFSAWPFFVQVESGWQPATIRPILDTHGIESWGWGKQGGEFFFQVKLRQANWTQYLLQQNGVPISGQLLDEGNRSAYRPVARQSTRPVSGATPLPRNATPAHTDAPETPPSLLRDPVGRINSAVDRLAKW